MKGGKSKADGKSTDAALKPRAAGRSKKAVKDPNKPKRPPSAFFVFMEEFRKVFKEKNPNNKSVAAVSFINAVLWPCCSNQDKATYKAKADKRKAEYEKTMDAYNKKQVQTNPSLLFQLPDYSSELGSYSSFPEFIWE
ncbi:unnamed protein product [Linum tenue]|uniref:HMG box domain-containing protein n=1 Tax=Linum tenue TaxID=586396 RepID=A0AAV0KI31_9ROSI|nr:unnamed protein product [Linum tenue]